MLLSQEQIEECDHSSCATTLVSNQNISSGSPGHLCYILFPRSQTLAHFAQLLHENKKGLGPRKSSYCRYNV